MSQQSYFTPIPGASPVPAPLSPEKELFGKIIGIMTPLHGLVTMLQTIGNSQVDGVTVADLLHAALKVAEDNIADALEVENNE